MVTEVVMTVWIRLVQGSEKVKDQDVDETHGKSEGVHSKNEVPAVEPATGTITCYLLLYQKKRTNSEESIH